MFYSIKYSHCVGWKQVKSFYIVFFSCCLYFVFHLKKKLLIKFFSKSQIFVLLSCFSYRITQKKTNLFKVFFCVPVSRHLCVIYKNLRTIFFYIRSKCLPSKPTTMEINFEIIKCRKKQKSSHVLFAWFFFYCQRWWDETFRFFFHIF